MDAADLDDIDFGILHLLQEDARNQTPVDMAERLPVTDQTIRNRIERLEEKGVIEGYVPLINYEKAGFPLRIQFTCTAPLQQRADLAEQALHIRHVVHVEELLSASHNVQVLTVTNESAEVNQVAAELDALGLTIEREQLQEKSRLRPFNHFGDDVTTEE